MTAILFDTAALLITTGQPHGSLASLEDAAT